jgi:eukaryotic-like serine/threonine-protein kinase
MSSQPVMQPSARDASGEPFGKYLLLDRIGQGGMAEVFRAVANGPEGFQSTLVIKRILPHLSQDPAFVGMFIDEAKVSGLLSHPNLVKIYEFGKVDENFFIAMELVHGRTLTAMHSRLARRNQVAPVSATAEICRQVCVGLHHAHFLRASDGQPLGIIHRDISPSNVMLAFHGGVKILDFGIARVAENLRQTHTQVGAVKGKISYMSPEQVRNEDIDHRSDIFGVGVVLHELLSGRRLFRGTSEYSAGLKVTEMPIPPPSQVNPAVSPALERVVMRALARDRDARYSSAGEMAADLDQVMHEGGMSPRDHTRLLDDLFPQEASATDIGLVLPRMLASRERPAGYQAVSSSGVEIQYQKIRDRPVDPVSATQPRVEPAPPSSVVPGMGPWSGRTAWRAGLVVVVLCAFALGIFALVRRPTQRREADAAPSWTHTPASGPPPTVVPTESNVRFFLNSSPQGAIVTRLDDKRVVGRTPLLLVVARSGSPLALRFERAGKKPATKAVVPDADKVVEVELGPETAQGTGRRKPKRSSARDFLDATPVDPFTK